MITIFTILVAAGMAYLLGEITRREKPEPVVVLTQGIPPQVIVDLMHKYSHGDGSAPCDDPMCIGARRDLAILIEAALNNPQGESDE